MIIQQICSRQRLCAPAPAAGCASPVPDAVARRGVAGIVCEVAGTLYDDTCWWRWMMQLVSHMGVHLEFESFYQGWELHCAQDACRGRNGFWHALRSYLLSCGLSRGACDEVLVAGQARFRRLDQGLKPLVGVRETLVRLASQPVTLVAVCNWMCSTAQLQAKLDSMAIGGCFDRTLSSLDGEDAMPAVSFFRRILASENLPADQTVFLSSQGRHLAGAARAGMITAAFNHRTPVEADIHLDRFADLLHAVQCHEVRAMAG
jgi:FMN phosphatase YigB (HAD superfamily)